MAGNWDDRRLWHPIGYALTAAWMLIVVTGLRRIAAANAASFLNRITPARGSESAQQ